MNAHTPPPAGHNNPPDPLDEAIATDAEALELAEGILTGDPVETEEQMHAVDAIAKRLKAVLKAVTAAKESESKPLHDAWKAALARYKPTETDLEKQIKGCVAMVDGFKRKLAAEKEAERKAKERAAWEAAEAARKASAEAAASDIEAQRAAAEAQRQAEEAQRAATAAAKDTVKGMRTVTCFEVTDHRALLHWIAANRRDDITAFLDEWAQKNHRNVTADGLRVWQEKAAF